MTRSGAEYFAEALAAYGVEHLFGNPGTTEVPFIEALDETEIEYILGLQEDIAVGMASGYACTRRERLNGEIGDAVRQREGLPLGVINLHIAPGVAHGLGNLYAASVSNAPLLVTAGCHKTGVQHQEPILHGDLVEMTDQFTKWSAEVKQASSLPTMLRRAVTTALSEPMGPVFLALPLDVMLDDVSAPIEPLSAPASLGCAATEDVDRAAEAIAAADEPTIIVGDQIAWAGADAVDATVRLAEAAGARVHGEVLMSNVDFPMGHDQWVSPSGGSADAVRSVTDTDTLIQIGCSTNTPTLGFTEPIVPEDTTVVDIGVDAWELGKNVPVDVSVIGDLESTVGELAATVETRVDDDERDRRLSAVRSYKQSFLGDDGATESADEDEVGDKDGADDESGKDDDEDERISKEALVNTIESVAPEAYLVDESITTRRAVYSEFDLTAGQVHGNKSGGLGYGLPASVGAAIAEKERDDPRPVIGLIGDGSYLYYPNTLYSAARHDIDLTIVVSNNANYRILKDNTMRVLGGSEADYAFTGMDFDPHVDIAANAESHGARGVDVVGQEAFERELSAAIETDDPTVLDVHIHD